MALWQMIGKLGYLGALAGLPGVQLRVLGFRELAVAAANIVVELGGDYNFLILVARVSGYSAADIARFRFNEDAGNNYGAVASEPQDAAATSTLSTGGILVGELTQTTPRGLLVAFVRKEIPGRVARLVGIGLDDSEAIATTVTMLQFGGIWGNTTSLIRSVTLNGGAAGSNLNVGSNLLVLGCLIPQG